MSDTPQDRLRTLPQVGEMLSHPTLSVDADLPAWAVKEGVRDAIDGLRRRLIAGEEVVVDRDAVAEAARDRATLLSRDHLRRVINATGVVVHTNLGRSPLPARAQRHLRQVAGCYTNVEFDIERGKRGGRGAGVERLLLRLTGAEAALVVNNNAAAVFLALRALAEGREVAVSRGELVEIGGSFRIPDVMRSSGAILREIGTTNRTHLRDYEDAVGDDTAMLLKVHRSNFRVIGFVAEVDRGPLVELGRRTDVPVVEDLGSGQLVPGSSAGEPVVRDAVAAGVDLVTFSGDKLLGGPQAGIVVGRKDLVQRLARDPMMRVLRVDKLTYAALEGTLRHYLDGEADQVPTHGRVHRDPADSRRAAEELLHKIQAGVPDLGDHFEATTEEVTGRAGGGAMAQVDLLGHAVSLLPTHRDASHWAELLRLGETPVIVRVADDRVWLDPRTLLPGDDDDLVAALAAVLP